MIQEKDLKIGMKVKIPKTKKYHGRPEESGAINNAKQKNQDFLYFVGKDEEEGHYILWDENSTSSGDFFGLEDLELYEETFVLPEKWGVRITEENREILREWVQRKEDYDEGFGRFNLEEFVVNKYYDRSYQYYNSSVKDLNKEGYTEITFEQFKQHVLKEEDAIKELPENYAVKTTNAEQVNICGTYMNNLGKKYPEDYKFMEWNYCVKDNKVSEGWDMQDDIPKQYKHLPIFTFQEWYELIKQTKSKEEMKLPTENFGIKVTNRNGENIVKWFKEKEYDIKNFDGNSSNGAIYCVENDKILDCCLPPEISSVIKIYTLEEIKQIENQTKNNMETKELLGYKLIKPEYKEAALKISRVSEFSKSSQYDFVNDSICARNLKEAGVLDLWFEKVFKEEEQYKVGDWVTVISVHGKGWLNDTKERTFQLLKLPTLYSRGTYWGVKNGGLHATFRKATEEEILAASYKTVKLSIGKNVDIERDKLSNQVYILAEGKHIQYKYINNLYCNTNTFGDTGWTIQYNTFDIGCWKNVTRDDLKLILDAYEEINGKQ